MDHVALDEVLRPFLQLPALADLEGQQAVDLTFQPGAEFGVAIEQLRRADGCVEQIADDAQVHGRSHANTRRSLGAGLAGVLEFDLGRAAGGGDQPAFAVFHQPVRAELGRAF
jgi:hypothetical protein